VSGLDAALARAIEKAGGADVAIGGGANVIRQALAAGRVDELVLSTAPVILGAGKRLFDVRPVHREVMSSVIGPRTAHDPVVQAFSALAQAVPWSVFRAGDESVNGRGD
jgi:dihydrofolate reductase